MSVGQENERRRPIAAWGVDVGLSLFFATVGLLAIVDSRRLGAGWAADGPQSGYFPFLVGGALLAASLINLIEAVRTRDKNREFVTLSQLRMVGMIFVPTVIYVVAIPFLGIYLASTVLAAAFLHFIGGYRWWLSALFGIAVAVAAFIVFDIYFLVNLPKGPVEEVLGY